MQAAQAALPSSILTLPTLLPQQERLGPGTYNIRDFLQETRPSSLRGICDTREQRFRDAHRVSHTLTPEMLGNGAHRLRDLASG